MFNKKVDIIIPIYNAFEDLNICINSLKKYTNLNKHRVILVNDNSPDERIRPYLNQLAQEDAFIVVHNETNKGFSANINIGMSQSEDRDVILLNSDTVLTANWVDKMLECAYSNPSIGTVTPLSNNATLCSVPNFCEENKLPEYLSVDDAGSIIEECSFKDYPRITVAHGFCMLVKREVINKIGGFDAETFQRGYGEENDFCCRAMELGYVNAMCDNTFILHTGTKSFISKEKEKLIQSHQKILEERYPELIHNNAVYCRDNPNKYISDNVGLFFNLRNGKKNILYVLHSDFQEGRQDNVGGTQFHVKDLVDGLRFEKNVYVLARDGEKLCVTAYIEERKYGFTFDVGKPDNYIVDSNSEIKKVFENVLEAFHIDVIHVHHIIGLSFDAFSIAKDKNIPIILTAHDFYYICPTIKMIDNNGVYCGKCIADDKCKECLRENLGIISTVDYLSDWRNRVRNIFDICKFIIFPSNSDKEIYESIYPEYKTKYKVIEHGNHSIEEYSDFNFGSQRNDFSYVIDKKKLKNDEYIIEGRVYAYDINLATEQLMALVSSKNDNHVVYPIELTETDYSKGIAARFSCKVHNTESYNSFSIVIADKNKYYKGTTKSIVLDDKHSNKYKLNVGFIGGLDESKGSKIVKRIVEEGTKDIHWYTFGTIGDADLFAVNKSNYTAIGKYRNTDLSMLLKHNKIDVIGILSIWPETYSYTLSEAIANGIPVIVTDLGALGDRVKEYGCGEVISGDDVVNQFLNQIDILKSDSDKLKALKEKVCNVRLKSIPEMVNDYKRFYDDILNSSHRKYGLWDKKYVFMSSDAEKLTMYNKMKINVDDVELWKKEAREYQVLKTTLTYEIMHKIITMRFPFQKRIMDIVYKMFRK